VKSAELKMKIILLLIAVFVSSAYSQIAIPVLKNYASDQTSSLNSSELNILESKLKTFDDSTSNQVVFLMKVSVTKLLQKTKSVQRRIIMAFYFLLPKTTVK